MKKLTLIFVLTLLSMPALANWTSNVDYVEALFPCDGREPDLSATPAVNVATKLHSEFRLPQDAVFSEDTVFYFKPQSGQPAVRLGALEKSPTCRQDDAGEPYVPSWTQVLIDNGLTIRLDFLTDFNSCAYSSEGGVFSRLNKYVLSVHAHSSTPETYSWQEQGLYQSPQACSTLEN